MQEASFRPSMNMTRITWKKSGGLQRGPVTGLTKYWPLMSAVRLYCRAARLTAAIQMDVLHSYLHP